MITTQPSPLSINPFRTAVPFRGQTTEISRSLFPKRDCGTIGVNGLSWPYIIYDRCLLQDKRSMLTTNHTDSGTGTNHTKQDLGTPLGLVLPIGIDCCRRHHQRTLPAQGRTQNEWMNTLGAPVVVDVLTAVGTSNEKRYSIRESIRYR